MDYRDLLNRCKQQPGWLASTEEKDDLAQAKYLGWVEKMNQEHKDDNDAKQKLRI